MSGTTRSSFLVFNYVFLFYTYNLSIFGGWDIYAGACMLVLILEKRCCFFIIANVVIYVTVVRYIFRMYKKTVHTTNVYAFSWRDIEVML